jgi:hypothetical protein
MVAKSRASAVAARRRKWTATLHDPTGWGTTYRASKDGNLQVLCTLPQPTLFGKCEVYLSLLLGQLVHIQMSRDIPHY